jgi:glycosyl transferase, family 25
MFHMNLIPLFVISLPGSPRLDSLKERLIMFNIAFEKIEAIDGRLIEKNELPALYDENRALKKLGRPMTRGEIGNALSHRKVWRIIVERNLPAALVLEEDAIIDQSFCSFLQILNEIPKKIGFLSLYAQDGRVVRRPSAALGQFKLHKAIVGLPNTVAYFITANYARMLLSRGTRVENPTDWPLGYLDREQYLVFPMPVSHNYDDSVINPDRLSIVRHRAKPLKTLWPSWIPTWLRATAYFTCIVYLLRPDRYDGFAEYFKRQVVLRIRLALYDTVAVARLGNGRPQTISERLKGASVPGDQ